MEEFAGVIQQYEGFVDALMGAEEGLRSAIEKYGLDLDENSPECRVMKDVYLTCDYVHLNSNHGLWRLERGKLTKTLGELKQICIIEDEDSPYAKN